MGWFDALLAAAARVPLIYYIFLNALLFAVMGWDKFCARHQRRRVPEKNLLILGLLGGGVGGLAGMQAFHHKTRKPVFWAVFTAAFFVHIALWFMLCRAVAA